MMLAGRMAKITSVASETSSRQAIRIRESLMNVDEHEYKIIYKVLVNEEGQYSIWSVDLNNPLGWDDVGKSGSKAECLAQHRECMDRHATAQHSKDDGGAGPMIRHCAVVSRCARETLFLALTLAHRVNILCDHRARRSSDLVPLHCSLTVSKAPANTLEYDTTVLLR